MPVLPAKMKNPIESWNDADRNLFNIIRKTVKEDQKAVQETARKCKKLFKQKNSPADPNVLIQLEKVLRERQNEQTLAKHIDPSKQKNGPKTPDELKESLKKQREDYECYIQHFLPALKAEITESKKLDSKKKAAIVQTILDITNRSRDESRSSVETAAQSTNVAEKKSGDNKILSNSDVTEEVFEKHSKVVEKIEEKQTSKLSSGNDSDSGIDSPRTSKESLKSPVSSRRSSLTLVTSTSSKESVNSTSNPAKEKDNGLQSEQAVEKKPQVQESGNSGGQKGKISSQIKGGLKSNGEKPGSTLPGKEELKLEEKEEKAVLSKQEASNNQNNSEVKQPNNRNLHVALVAGCALSTIGCIVAGVMTSGLVGAGLLAMAAVFAIAAVAELHSNFLSSKLTSISVEPHVNDKELTACSRL